MSATKPVSGKAATPAAPKTAAANAKELDKKQAIIAKFERKARNVRLYSLVCAVSTAVFTALYATETLPAPLLDVGDKFAQVGSIEFNFLAFFMLLHGIVVFLLKQPITAQRAAVGIALSVCASLVYILLFLAIHLSNFLEMQMDRGEEGQGPPRPEEGSGLAMAGDYFASLEAQREAAAAGYDIHAEPEGGFGGGINLGELSLMAITTIVDIFFSVLDPKKWAKAKLGANQPHAPMFYLARPEMLMLSVIGFLVGVVVLFSIDSYAEVTMKRPPGQNAAKPSAPKARNPALTQDALKQHVEATSTPAEHGKEVVDAAKKQQ